MLARKTDFFAKKLYGKLEKKDAIDGLIEKELHNSMKDFGVDNVNVTKTGEEPEYNPVAAAWNVIQKEFKCSGTDGYQDWTNTTIMGSDSRFSQYLDVRFSLCFLL